MKTKILIVIAGAAALPACNTTNQEEITQVDPAAPPVAIEAEPQQPKVGIINRDLFRVPDPTKDLVGADTSPRPRRDLPRPTPTPGPLPVIDENPEEAPNPTPGPTPLPEAATTDSPEGAPLPAELPGSPGPVLGLAD